MVAFLQVCSLASDINERIREAAFSFISVFPLQKLNAEIVKVSLSKKYTAEYKFIKEKLQGESELKDEEKLVIFAAGAFVYGLEDEFHEVLQFL